MGFSRDLIRDHYIAGVIAPVVFIEPKTTFKALFEQYKNGGFTKYNDSGWKFGDTTALTKISREIDWALKSMNAGEEALWKGRKGGSGTYKL